MIILDNFSTDETPMIIKNLINEGLPIILIPDEDDSYKKHPAAWCLLLMILIPGAPQIMYLMMELHRRKPESCGESGFVSSDLVISFFSGGSVPEAGSF